MKRLTALFSNMMGQGADCIYLGRNINELTVNALNAELPIGFASHFFWGYCDVPKNSDPSQFDVEWLIPYMADGTTIVYNKDKQLFTEKIA